MGKTVSYTFVDNYTVLILLPARLQNDVKVEDEQQPLESLTSGRVSSQANFAFNTHRVS